MKGPFFNRIFLFAFFLLISINKTTQSESTELNMIADASLNATATFASFDHNYYLYFLYDMNPFFADNNFRTGAIFKLTSKKRFYSYDISYFPSSKKIDTINSTDIIGNKVYINWRYLVDLFAQRTTSNEYDHYLKIKRSSLQINSLNTLVIRINVLNKRGDLTIENLLSLSEDIEKALYNKTNNYISYKNLRDSLNKNNYNNNHNYHNDIYNNNNNNNYHKNYYNNNNNYHKDYYYNNNNNNYNYGNYKNYGNIHHSFHFRTHHKRFYFHNIGFSYAGIIFAQIWFIVFILYCIVNRRKPNNNRIAVIVGNMPQ